MSIMHSGDVAPFDAPPSAAAQGRYSVIASLGQGGMANIFLAVMSGPAGFNKLLVLKVLRDDLETNRDDLASMFLDEAHLAARLQHRNLVQTYEFGEIGGRYHITMEYLEGQSLRALQQRIAPAGLPLAEELYILAETARGLHYAHELKGFDGVPLGVVHRDISPQNVFVTYAGEVKLLDFGIAKTAGAERLTQVGVIKGKVDYIAPEQVRGEGVDRRADIFSLGAMLWEAITKDRFGGGTKVMEVTKFHKRLTGGEPNVRAVRPDVPEALASILDRAVALDPNRRFATAEEFADSIETYLETLAAQPNEKSLAELLARTFADQRERLRKRVEHQIQRIQARDRLSEPLRSGARTLDLSLTMSGVVDLNAPTALNVRADLPTSSPAGATTPRGASWRMPVIAASSLLLAIAAGSAVTQGRHNPPGATTQSAAAVGAVSRIARSVEATPAAPAPLVAERSVSLAVEVSPSTARVTLDGVSLPGLPFVGSFPSSSATHLLEVSADGFQTERQLVVFGQDQTIKIVMRPAAAPLHLHARRPLATTAVDVAATTLPASSARRTTSPHVEEPEPGAELKTRLRQRDFDMKDPYAE
jgi:serine/threonine-protein kinase